MYIWFQTSNIEKPCLYFSGALNFCLVASHVARRCVQGRLFIWECWWAFDVIFIFPDFIVLVLLSLIRSYKRQNWIEYVILGGFAYASLFCLALTIVTKSGFLPTGTMLLGLGFNVFIVFSDQLFVESRHSDKRINALKTFVQIVLIWTLTLFVIPSLLLNAAGKKLS